MRNYDCVIFDIDGTIVSTIQLIYDSMNFVADKYSGRIYTPEELTDMFGPTEEFILKNLFGKEFKKAEEDYFRFYSENHSKYVTVFPQIKEIITDLKKKNIHLAIFTGKGRRSTLITLDKTGFNGMFEYIITGDDVVNHKPDSEGILKILDYFKVSKNRTLMIGDSDQDVIAAKSAGIKVMSVLWDSFSIEKIKKLNPDFLCDDTGSLKFFLQKNL